MKPLKIMHVANRAEKKSGKVYYSLPYKINNGFIRNGHNVLWFSDRDTARALAFIKSQKLGIEKCNKRFFEYCLHFRPDLIVLGHADIIRPETLNNIKNHIKSVKIIQYNIDGLFIQHNKEMIQNKLDCVDFTFVTTAGDILKTVATKSAHAAFFPNPTDPSIDIYNCSGQHHFAYDVFFAGQKSDICDSHDLRNQIPKLPEVLTDVRCGLFDSVWGTAYYEKLGQSRMGLNFSIRPAGTEKGSGGPLYFYSSDRISQYLGNGLLTLSNDYFDLAELYGPGSLVEVSSFEDLVEKIKFYAKNDKERMKIAEKGYTIAHTEFNERLVARYFVETAFGIKYSHEYQWPTEIY